MLKTYKIVVSFGDGRPVQTTVEAKNGPLAQDLAYAKHPGARSILILGIESVREEPRPKVQLQRSIPEEEPPHPLFTDTTVAEVNRFIDLNKQNKVKECLKLRRQGLSHKSIAEILGVGKTTVGSWLKQYSPG